MSSRILTITEDWEEVFDLREVDDDLWTADLPSELKTDTLYYRTFGGGPEGGYFVKGSQEVYKVRRSLYQPWSVELLKGVTLEFEGDDEMKGKTARCRLVEKVDVTQTRKIVDKHRLWGNAIEVVKCLRDGLSPKVDASYKDLCLGIILDHFQYIDKYLDLLPADSCPSYKELLNELKKDHDEKDEERESVESDSSDSE